ncbi:hypothetical protein HY948_03075 [Candidatus Gottesmanbacteria bacterium]|nr:hypothetical protein [Candidatus Gottesmanbacteria bacterium]
MKTRKTKKQTNKRLTAQEKAEQKIVDAMVRTTLFSPPNLIGKRVWVCFSREDQRTKAGKALFDHIAGTTIQSIVAENTIRGHTIMGWEREAGANRQG